MKNTLSTFALLLVMAACGNRQTTPSVPDVGGASNGMTCEERDLAPESEQAGTTYLSAIDRYMVEEIGRHYDAWEHCVPLHNIVGVDESNAEDILVWGDFWVFNYTQAGDTLKCVSGGSYPGLMHVGRTDEGFVVTAFDQVEDGSRYQPTARKIFGDKYDAFVAISSDDVAREELRAKGLAEYVKRQGLSATMYQDFGWPAKELKSE